MDMEMLGTFVSGIVYPGYVFHVIAVKDIIFALFLPGDLVGPFNAVLRLARDGSNGAEWNCWTRCVHIQLALNAG
jgi:hypothetical protein